MALVVMRVLWYVPFMLVFGISWCKGKALGIGSKGHRALAGAMSYVRLSVVTLFP